VKCLFERNNQGEHLKQSINRGLEARSSNNKETLKKVKETEENVINVATYNFKF
jgi:hypothetical protein